MKQSFLVAALALFFAVQAAHAQPPATLPPQPPAIPGPADAVPPPAFDGPGLFGQPTDGADGGRLWFSAEALAWWLRGMKVPPLATTSPDGTARGQAGVLNSDSTTVLYGNERVNSDPHFGGRFSLGYINPDSSFPVGFEGNFFSLATTTTHFDSPDGNTIVGRPFFDNSAGHQDALLVNFPGSVSGSSQINTTQFLLGAEALVRETVYQGPTVRLDALGGYRFLNLREQLHITDSFNSTDPASLLPVGTGVLVNDNFETINCFHGGEVGLAGTWSRGALSLQAVTKLAVGGDNHRLVINGFTTTTPVDGSAARVTPGGLLAQPSNSGRTNGTDWALVPEGVLNLRWDLNSHLRLTAGYTFLWWNSVVRPGDQIDTVVNRTGLSGGTQVGENRPILQTTTSGIWVQGIQLGLTYSF
jgi:hypothetical protein